MISFIVIGRNEEANIGRCLSSIINTVEINCIAEYEIIYVDSNSNDNSIVEAKKFIGVKIIKILNIYSVAIGRHIGAINSKGDVYFFIDADMEINPEFLMNIFYNGKNMMNKLITGHILDIYRSGSSPFKNKNESIRDDASFVLSGIFLIEKDSYNRVKGFNSKYKNCYEDYDLLLRLSNTGVKILKINKIIARHFTDNIYSGNYFFHFFKKNSFFYNAVLHREHFFNKTGIRMFFINQKTGILFLLFLFLSIFLNWYFLILFFLIILIKNIIRLRFKYLVWGIAYDIARGILFWIGFLFFYPGSIDFKDIKYEEII